MKYNYTEPDICVVGRVCCRDCKHSINKNGQREYGTIKDIPMTDKDYGSLFMPCYLQNAYVKPYAWCDNAKGDRK